MAKYKSGVRFKFLIEYTGGESVVIVNDLRDVLQWERNHGGQSFVANEPSLDQLLWVAWAKAKRTGQTDLRFEKWTDTIEDFDPDQADKPGTESDEDDATTDEDGEPTTDPVPTNAGAGAGE